MLIAMRRFIFGIPKAKRQPKRIEFEQRETDKKKRRQNGREWPHCVCCVCNIRIQNANAMPIASKSTVFSRWQLRFPIVLHLFVQYLPTASTRFTLCALSRYLELVPVPVQCLHSTEIDSSRAHFTFATFSILHFPFLALTRTLSIDFCLHSVPQHRRTRTRTHTHANAASSSRSGSNRV